MEGLLITEKEKARKELCEEVCKMYVSLCVKFPDSRPYRRFGTIAENIKKSITYVAGVCIENGLYQSKKRKGGEYDTRATES